MQTVPDYIEDGFFQCIYEEVDHSSPLREGTPSLTLLVLDNAYVDGVEEWHKGDRERGAINSDPSQYPPHDYPLLTPQIRATAPRWKSSGLLEATTERILFIQNIEPKHCTLARSLMAPHTFHVYGHRKNTGIAGGVRFLVTRATGDHVLFLERDFLPSEQMDRSKVAKAMLHAQELLSRAASPRADVVLLRHLRGLGYDRGHGGVSSVCLENNLKLAWWNECVRGTSLKRFFTATAALDLCTSRALEEGKGKVTRCGPSDDAFPRTFCYSSLYAHWTNNPFVARRRWLLRHFVPLLSRCSLDDTECLYASGIETNRELQCTLRRMNYTVAQTEGIFRHLNLRLMDRAECESERGGYWIPDQDTCQVWL